VKKIVLAFLLCAVVIILGRNWVHADEIIETPEIRIIIDGKIATYTDVPLSMNQRTLLPLREILVDLGVQNDDEHISWNGDDKSVTIYKDNIKIYLKIGSSIAYVNDRTVTLDTAPVGYKSQRVYIPARFVSQALGKRVVWDGITRTVLIRSEEEFNSIKDIFQKTDTAMNSAASLKYNTDVSMNLSKADAVTNYSFKIRADIDKEGKVLYLTADIPFFGQSLNFESYLADNTENNKDVLTGKWESNRMTESEFEEAFRNTVSSLVFKADDVVYAGLCPEDNPGTDEILLKGNVLPGQFFDMIEGNIDMDKYKENETLIEILIDKNTNYIKSIRVDIDGIIESNNEEAELKSTIICTYSDYNGDFEIKVPEGL